MKLVTKTPFFGMKKLECVNEYVKVVEIRSRNGIQAHQHWVSNRISSRNRSELIRV